MIPKGPVQSLTELRGDIASKNLAGAPDRGGQGRRSRGAHVWAPCLEGPGPSQEDTMDVAGPSGPAWMRLVLFHRWRSTGAVPQDGARRDGGVGLPTLVELCASNVG